MNLERIFTGIMAVSSAVAMIGLLVMFWGTIIIGAYYGIAWVLQ